MGLRSRWYQLEGIRNSASGFAKLRGAVSGTKVPHTLEDLLYRISKQFHFSAAHQLDQLPEGHPCRRLHGHNYIVEVVLEAEELDERFFVADYHELGPVKDFIDERLDHRNLDDVMETPSTAENIAKFFFDKFKSLFPALSMVRVSETPKTWAEYFETPR